MKNKLIKLTLVMLFITTTVLADDLPTEPVKVFINVCRPSSFIRQTQRPDFFVKGALVSDIASGAVKRFSAEVGVNYALKTQTNFLMFRFKDESLFQSVVTTKEDIYLIVKGQLASAGAVVSQLFGGAIAESIRQNNTDSPSGDWTVEVVTQSDYDAVCSEIK